ncbi:MAG: prephenate dehydratase [Bacteroidia bacterium]|nr:prephenate dehydratase [Bacteroidia bacterium]
MQTVLTPSRHIAIQGFKGSFHELAARKYFGDDITLEMCDTFPRLFRHLAQGTAHLGVVAIENSVAGTILPNYSLLRNTGFVIAGEVYLRIEQNLMALPGQRLEDIREVHSHPMALQQCMQFLDAHPHIRLVESADTAASAIWIRENNLTGVAAIASRLAAEQQHLEILAPGIETNKRNFTRFWILADPETAPTLAPAPDKSSLCFNLVHKVGSLAQILLVLGSHGMNLTKIQSLPIVGHEWEYFFHLDVEFEDLAQFQRALAAITPLVNDLQILGTYPRGSKDGLEA